MKVILLEDVPQVGHKGEEKEVKSGYARNFLIPKGLVQYADPQALKNLKQTRVLHEEDLKKQKTQLGEALNSIKDKHITIAAKANEKDNLFAGIGKKEIAKFLKEQSGVSMPPEALILDTPIKKVGEYEIEVVGGEGDGKVKFVLKVENDT